MDFRERFLTRLFPTLSVIIGVIGVFFFMRIQLFILTFIFGVIVGGIVPLILIKEHDIDTSPFFKGKIIIVAVYAVAIIISWLFVDEWLADGINVIILPVLSLIAEIVYATTRNTDAEHKLVLFLSSPVITYFAMLLDALL